jgi:hypothetical protein
MTPNRNFDSDCGESTSTKAESMANHPWIGPGNFECGWLPWIKTQSHMSARKKAFSKLSRHRPLKKHKKTQKNYHIKILQCLHQIFYRSPHRVRQALRNQLRVLCGYSINQIEGIGRDTYATWEIFIYRELYWHRIALSWWLNLKRGHVYHRESIAMMNSWKALQTNDSQPIEFKRRAA